MPENVNGLEEQIRRLKSELARKQESMQALAQSEAKYRRLVEGLEDEYIIFSHDMDGRYLYISPSVENILGVSVEQFLGRGWEAVLEIPKSSLAAGYRSDQICAQGKIPPPFELTVLRKDGREVVMEVKERPLFDRRGKVVANEGIAMDITERKRAENKLRTALAEIKTLRGIIPICANCKKIRDGKGYWQQIENYISTHSDASFSHGICPECVSTLYPGLELGKA